MAGCGQHTARLAQALAHRPLGHPAREQLRGVCPSQSAEGHPHSRGRRVANPPRGKRLVAQRGARVTAREQRPATRVIAPDPVNETQLDLGIVDEHPPQPAAPPDDLEVPAARLERCAGQSEQLTGAQPDPRQQLERQLVAIGLARDQRKRCLDRARVGRLGLTH